MSAPVRRSPTDLCGERVPSTAAGDLIRTGENLHPHYQVIALSEDRAWILDLQNGTNHLIPIDGRR